MTIIPVRWREFFYTGFSPYGLELICFDLRARRTHSITEPIARQCASVRDAVDREIVRHYVPGSTERNGALIKIMVGAGMEPVRELERGDFKAHHERIRVPIEIAGCIPERVEELGYDSFSSYFNGLVRFDLGIGGPHNYFDGLEMDEDYLRALDEQTVRIFRSKVLKPTSIDRRLEDVRGRKMTPEERDAELTAIAESLVMHATRPKR